MPFSSRVRLMLVASPLLSLAPTGGHTNLDFEDRLPAGDLMRNATIVASCARHAATADTKAPRKGQRAEGGRR